jgi:hypothetical protein
MTIKQQGGIFGRNPTFNDVEVDGTLTLEGGLSTNSALTVNAATSTIESTGGAQLYLSRDDTAVANNNLIGGLAFKANDSSASPDPQYCGMKAYAAGSGNNPVLEFYSGNGNYDARTPQLSINYLGNVTIANGNLIMGTSGNGIDFSATSGTGTSELFSDYEEGSFSPTLTTDGTDFSSVSYDSRRGGSYTKIGRMVHIQLTMITDSITVGSASGNVVIGGLPFPPTTTAGGGTDQGYAALSVANGSNWTSNPPTAARVHETGSYIQLMIGATLTAIADANTGSNDNYVNISGTYITD